MKRFTFLMLGIVMLASCTPKISTTITKNYAPLDYKKEVYVLNLNDSVPANAEVLGTVKIGDNGLSTNCGWSVVVEKAKMEARKAGGNVIKITKSTPPDMISSCHRITAQILKVENLASLPKKVEKVDSAMLKEGYALLHVYRFSGSGFLIGYNLHLGDSVLCRVKSNWKGTFKITKDGYNTIWAQTEAKSEVPVNIKYGHEYYVRCSITMGAFVGHPKLELVNEETGKAEFESAKLRNNDSGTTKTNYGNNVANNEN